MLTFGTIDKSQYAPKKNLLINKKKFDLCFSLRILFGIAAHFLPTGIEKSKICPENIESDV